MDTESSIQLLTPSTLDLLLRALIFIFLLGCSALISGSETALFSLSSTEIEEEAEKDSSSIIVQLLRRPQKLLATLLIANNLVNISIVLVFDPLGDFLFGSMNEWVRAIFEVGILTFVILLCGEILPKIYANRNNLAFARRIAPIIKVWGSSPKPWS